VCLSQDHICTLTAPRSSYWVPPERRAQRLANKEALDWQTTKRPYTYLVTDFVPMLRERGVSEADVETMLVDNPRRLLAGVSPGATLRRGRSARALAGAGFNTMRDGAPPNPYRV
jgi:hypothetical protein